MSGVCADVAVAVEVAVLLHGAAGHYLIGTREGLDVGVGAGCPRRS